MFPHFCLAFIKQLKERVIFPRSSHQLFPISPAFWRSPQTSLSSSRLGDGAQRRCEKLGLSLEKAQSSSRQLRGNPHQLPYNHTLGIAVPSSSRNGMTRLASPLLTHASIPLIPSPTHTPSSSGDHFCNGFSKNATEHPCDTQQFPRKGHGASGMQRRKGTSMLDAFPVSATFAATITFYPDYYEGLSTPVMCQARGWSRHGMAPACRASGLMGKNDRNLRLIMPGLEMFVTR
ncbi:hypothetical protein CRENBAI_012564 [Crenichthys baileyi]|uniref:Uncharacterized protein n=1 Tax=Crenichthys baileyi TaxID=28760 RepID=A0AAV9RAP8_9TELE